MKMIYAIDGFLPMRWVEYDHEEVPISMDKYFIHGRNILSMDLKYPWVPCNMYPARNEKGQQGTPLLFASLSNQI